MWKKLREKYGRWMRIFLYITAVLILAFVDGRGINRVAKEWTAVSRLQGQAAPIFSWALDSETSDAESKQQETVQKTAYLTFDDGPSANTDKILDVLKEKGVKATFFVVGKTGEKAEERYKRIVEEGHTLGLHSYSHDYSEIYSSLENYKADIIKLRTHLYNVTGQDVWLYRFPGGSSNSVAKISIQDCIAFLNEEGLTYMDWNASSEDAVAVNASCSTLNANILKDAFRFNNTVILMHDLYECCNTVEGLGTLIDRIQEEGYEIKPITKETNPVQHVKYKSGE